MNLVFDIGENYETDESIYRKETYAFYPITGTKCNNPCSITVTVQNSDNFYLPTESWLEIEGV